MAHAMHEAGARDDAHVARVVGMLAAMRERRIWPNGPRYLWTDGAITHVTACAFWLPGELLAGER